ncbi:MAG: TonB-dependent receptor [Desulfobacteraceae bacterium]|nr:TonB-dependent receptor [Desulfobacteraceae bacterium]
MNAKFYFHSKSVKTRLAGRMKKTAGILLLLPFISLVPAFCVGICKAESGQDMEVLRMFFEKEDLFTSVTRTPKPVSQIAENVTIVTSKEIKAMNAHTVAGVLNRVTGLFVNFSQGTGTMGSTSLLHLQGSEDRHVLVLVDGIPWNSMSGGTAETNTIPVGIIERIEIIKGPASASWGSALGGVVHIITKSPGYASGPEGSLQTSYGKNETMDNRAQVSGRAGRLGYYLYGGRQESDGPEDARYFEKESLFSRFSYTASSTVDLSLSLGYSQPDTGLGKYESADFASTASNRNFWANALMDATLTRELTLSISAFRFEQKSTFTDKFLGIGNIGSPGELYRKKVYDEAATGTTAKLVWQKGIHTAVIGADFNDGNMDQNIYYGQVMQSMGVPYRLHTNPDIEKTGIYFNDTIVLGDLSVTPGIRYDYSSVTGSFISPSLGTAYSLGNDTILRGSVARGFTSPPLAWTSGDGYSLNSNPSLEEERTWSFQTGIESAALRYLWIKGTLFSHEIDDVFELETGSSGSKFANKGESRRQGLEIEFETLPYFHTSLQAGAAYVNLDPANDYGAENIYAYNIGISYDNPELIRAELFGHYVWWDAEVTPRPEYDDFIWDLNLRKRLYNHEKIEIELFATGHNIFNGDQYLQPDNPNPERWFEAGVRMDF